MGVVDYIAAAVEFEAAAAFQLGAQPPSAADRLNMLQPEDLGDTVVFLASLPWISAVSPYLTISRHGLALWFTSPNLLAVLWPKKVNPLMVGLFATTVLVAFWDLCYQNSGWVQFGYRFSLDYMPMLILLLALGGRSLTGKLPLLALVFAIVVNTFGAITFDRVGIFYDDDATQDRLFQPD